MYSGNNICLKQGQYMVLATAALNLVLSYFLGKEFGIFGIIVATAIARLVTNFWYDPYVVLTLGLKVNPLSYLGRFSLYLLILFAVSGSVYFIFSWIQFHLWLQILLKVVLILVLFFSFIFLLMRKTTEYKGIVSLLKRIPLINRLI